jgi:hypothetical protein
LSPAGTFNNLLSLVTDPTTATILPYLFLRFLTILDIEIGYLFNRDWLSLFKITLLNFELVLRDRNV